MLDLEKKLERMSLGQLSECEPPDEASDALAEMIFSEHARAISRAQAVVAEYCSSSRSEMQKAIDRVRMDL